MIVFQVLAGLLLVPLTPLMLVLFNLYVRHWVYWLFIAIFTIAYSALWAAVFVNMAIVPYVFVGLINFYCARISLLYLGIGIKGRGCPLITASFKDKKKGLHVTFLLALSILKIFRWLPVISKDGGKGGEVSKLFEIILSHGKGAKLDIISDDADIYFEIK